MEIYSDENNKGWELVFSMFARRDYRDFFLLSFVSMWCYYCYYCASSRSYNVFLNWFIGSRSAVQKCPWKRNTGFRKGTNSEIHNRHTRPNARPGNRREGEEGEASHGSSAGEWIGWTRALENAFVFQHAWDIYSILLFYL